jgi:alkylhydroperoxidase/carboxymuconolactone decarboxylase family protein YurZ
VIAAEDDDRSLVDRLKSDGSWNELWTGLDELDPIWTEDYLTAVLEPYQSGVLPPQVVQLLCIAVDAACTHLYEPGLRRHIRAALDCGVTQREILEVLKMTTSVGIHSINVGLPILLEESESH